MRVPSFHGRLLWFTVFAILLLLLLSTTSCKTCQPDVQFHRVEVPVPIAPAQIEFRPPPEWLLPEVSADAPMQKKLQAIVSDLGMCRDYVDYLTYLLEVYNEASARFTSGVGVLTGDSSDAGGGSTD